MSTNIINSKRKNGKGKQTQYASPDSPSNVYNSRAILTETWTTKTKQPQIISSSSNKTETLSCNFIQLIV